VHLFEVSCKTGEGIEEWGGWLSGALPGEATPQGA